MKVPSSAEEREGRVVARVKGLTGNYDASTREAIESELVDISHALLQSDLRPDLIEAYRSDQDDLLDRLGEMTKQ